MGFIGTLIIGLVVGAVARLLFPGPQGLGLIMTMLLGIGGAMVATYGGQFVGIYHSGETAGFIGAVVGAIILLFVAGRLRK